MSVSVSHVSQPNVSESVLVELFEEIATKLQAGEPVDLDACARDHPEQAEQLRRLLPTIHVLADLGRSEAKGDPPVASLAAPAELERGVLGDFRIFRELGRGGMGIVYEAEQVSLGRRVALKVLPFAAAMDAKQLQRFKNEAQAAAHLQHTNIVPVYYVGCERGVHFYAMQYIEGQTLAVIIRELRQLSRLETASLAPSAEAASALASELAAGRWAPVKRPGGEVVGSCGREQATGPYRPASPPAHHSTTSPPHHPSTSPPPDDTSPVAALSTERSNKSTAFFRSVAHLGTQAAEALEHAHQLGVIHRDVKPANLLMDASGRLWVTDFGLAHCQGQPGLTMTGDLVGTLRYMSPEQALAKRVTVDARTDVYSLGVTLYELLTLEPAYDGRNREEVLRQITFEEPHPPSRLNKAVPAELETIILKGIAKNPEERYTTAQEFADDLRRYLEDKPIKAKRPSLRQRAVKWGRRHKTVVRAAFIVLVLAMVALAVSAALIWRTNQELQQTLYFQRIALAERECAANDMNRVDELLAACPTERRGWEWNYLRRLGRGGVLALHHESAALSVAFSPNGQLLASGSQDGTVTIWDTTTWGAIQSWVAHLNHHVRSVDFSPDSLCLATVGWDGTARVWDVRSGRALYTLQGKSKRYFSQVVFSSDGGWLASGGPDNDVELWDARTGELWSTLQGHQAQVTGLAFSPDGRRLASAGFQAVKIWDPTTGRLASGGFHDQAVKIWDPTTGRVMLSLSGQDGLLLSVAFSPDGRRLAAAGGRSLLSGCPGAIRVWDTATGEELLRLRGVKIWDVSAGQEFRSLFGCGSIPPLLTGLVSIQVALAPSVRTLRGHAAGVWAVAFSPEGQRLASGSVDRTVRIWNTKTWQVGLILRDPTGGILSVAFSPDGQRLATGGNDATLKVWDLATGQLLRTLHGHAHWVNAVAFSPDGRRLASGSLDGTVKLWDARP